MQLMNAILDMFLHFLQMQKIPTTIATINRDPAEINTIRDESCCEGVCVSGSVMMKKEVHRDQVSKHTHTHTHTYI